MSREDAESFSGTRLRTARNLLGMTQSALAERVGVTRQYIYKLERGDVRCPSDDLIEAFSEELPVSKAYFFEPEFTAEARDEDCFFRSRANTTQAARSQVLAHLNLLYAAVTYLARHKVALPPVNLPTVDNVNTAEDVERVAEKARLHWGLGLDAPISSMVRVLEHAGAIAAHFPGTSDRIDAFSWPAERPLVVRSTAKDSTSRARMDFSHELGHLLMHQGLGSEEGEVEHQAKRFGGAFLLPRVGFLREFPAGRVSWPIVFSIKRRWKVALSAIVRRAYNLRRIDAREYRRANIYISKKGWKRNEPAEPPEEPPELLQRAFEHLLQRDGIGANDVARHLQWSPETFERITGIPLLAAPVIPLHRREGIGRR